MPTARVAWIVAALLVVGTYVAAVPVAYATYRAYAPYKLAAEVVYSLGYWATGALNFWKRSDNRVGLIFSFMLVMVGALNVADVPVKTYGALDLLGAFISFFGWVTFFLAFVIFPDARPVPRWTRWSMIVCILYMALLHFAPENSSFHPKAWPSSLVVPLAMGLFGTLIVAQTYRYRWVSRPVERQQTKWVVFGLGTALAGAIVVALIKMAYWTSTSS